MPQPHAGTVGRRYRSHHPALYRLLLGGAVLTLVAGCSSSAATASPAASQAAAPASPAPSTAAQSQAASTAPSAGAAAPSLSTNTVRLAMVTPFNLGSVAIFGADKGLNTWQGTGVTVNLTIATSPTADPLLATGAVDMVDESPNKPVADITKGLPATIVGAESLCWGQVVIAAAKEHITSVSQLKGKTFGVSGFGSGGYFATLKVAQHFGWSKSQYKVTQLGGLPQLVAALKSGAIDAFIWNDLEGANLQAQGVATDLGSVSPYITAAGDVYVVSNKFLQQHPDTIKAFFTGLFATQAKLKADPSLAQPIAVNDYHQSPSATASVLNDEMGCLSTDGAIPSANLQGIAAAAQLSNPDLKSVDMSKIYTYWKDLP